MLVKRSNSDSRFNGDKIHLDEFSIQRGKIKSQSLSLQWKPSMACDISPLPSPVQWT